MMETKKLTAREILQIVEDANLSVAEFAHGDFIDVYLFTDYTDEQKEHIRFFNDYCSGRYRDPVWQKYAEKHNLPTDFYKFEDKCWQDAGSPKSPLGEWEEVASGGGMDRGSDWFSVKYFKDHGVYIRTNGYYQSHHGTDFDEGYGHEVFPKTKVVQIFE